jgi:hypothetical protein
MIAALTAAHNKQTQWTRAGHRDASIKQGPRGNETPMPITQTVTARNNDGTPTRWGPVVPADSTDRQMRRINNIVEQSINDAIKACERAITALRWYEIETDTAGAGNTCNNPRCQQTLDSDRQHGECARCRKHRSRHGTQWPTTN